MLSSTPPPTSMAHAAGCGLHAHSFKSNQMGAIREAGVPAERLVRQAALMPLTLGGAPNTLHSPKP